MDENTPTTDIDEKKVSRLQRAIDFLNQVAIDWGFDDEDEKTEGET